jgi:hypothetical protein
MVQVIPQYDIGGILGQAIGGGFQRGIQTGLQNILKQQALQQKAAVVQQKQLQKNIESLPRYLDSFLKSLGGKEYQEDERRSILDLAEPMVRQGSPLYDALSTAVKVYENPEQYGVPQEMIDKKAPTREPEEQITRRAARAAGRWLFEPRGLPSPEEEKEISTKVQKARTSEELSDTDLLHLKWKDLEDYPAEEKEKIQRRMDTLSTKVRGTLGAAIVPFVGRGLEERVGEYLGIPARAGRMADIARMATELPLLGPILGAGGLLSQAVRGAAAFGGARAAEEAIRVSGTEKPADLDAIALDTAVGGLFPFAMRALEKLGKPLINATKNLMRRAKVPAGEAAERITREATREGVDLGRVAAGEASEVKELKDIADRFAEVKRPTPKEVRPVRVFEEAPKIKRPPPEEAKIFEKQVKLYDKLEGEIKKDAEAIATREARIKRPETLAKEANIRKVASASVPEIQENYSRIFRNRARIEDEFRTLPKDSPGYNRIKALVKDAKTQEKRAEEALKEAIYQSNTGLKRPVSDDIKIQISDTLKKIEKESLDPTKEIKDIVTRYNEERVQRGLRLIKKKPLPGDVYEDTYSKVMREYIDKFKGRAEELRKTLKDTRTILGYPAKELAGMRKELESLEKMIQRDTANLAIHEREKGLREIARRKGIKERLETAKPIEIPEHAKPSEKYIRERINAGFKLGKQFPETVEIKGPKWGKITTAVGVEKAEESSFAKALREMRGAAKGKEKFKSYDDARKYMVKRMSLFLKPIKNQLAVGFALGLVDPIAKKLTGRKIPPPVKYASLGAIGLGGKRGIRYPFLALTAYATDQLAKGIMVNQEARNLSKLRGREYLEAVRKLRVGKEFTAKEVKEILRKRQEFRRAA